MDLIVAYSAVYSVPVLFVEQVFDLAKAIVLDFNQLHIVYPFLETMEVESANLPILLPCVSPCNTVAIMNELGNKQSYLDAWMSVYLPMLLK